MAFGNSASFTVKFVGDISSLSKSMGEAETKSATLEGHITGLGSKLKGLATVAAGFVGFYGLEKAFTSCVEGAMAMEKAHNTLIAKIQQFGGNVKQAIPLIDQWANKQAEFGMTATDAETALGRLATMTGSVQMGMKAYDAALEISKATGKSFTAVSLAAGKAFDGQTTALARYIGTIPKGISSQQLFNDVQEKYGGLAKANTNSMDVFRASLSNLEEKIGMALMPTLSKLMGKWADWLTQNKNQKTVVDDVTTALKALGDIISIVWKAADLLYTGLSKVKDLFGSWKPVIIGVTAALVALGMVDPWVALAAGALYTIEHWKQVEAWFKDFWEAMKIMASTAWDEIKRLTKEAVYIVLQMATAGIRGILELASHLPWVGDKAKAALDDINNYINKWNPNFDHATAAFAKGGTVSGEAFAKAAAQAMNPAGGYVAGPGAKGGSKYASGANLPTAPGVVGGATGIQAGLVNTAKQALGNPYQWGGTPSISSPTDCSGLMVAVFAAHGISIPRRSEEQYSEAPIRDARPLEIGDLVFAEGNHPGHVGLYIGNNTVLEDPHTGARVKETPLGEFGWNGESARWWGGKKKSGGSGSKSSNPFGSTPSNYPQSTPTSSSTSSKKAATVSAATVISTKAAIAAEITKAIDAPGPLDEAEKKTIAKMKELADQITVKITPEHLAKIKAEFNKLKVELVAEMKDVGLQMAKAAKDAKDKIADALNRTLDIEAFKKWHDSTVAALKKALGIDQGTDGGLLSAADLSKLEQQAQGIVDKLAEGLGNEKKLKAALSKIEGDITTGVNGWISAFNTAKSNFESQFSSFVSEIGSTWTDEVTNAFSNFRQAAATGLSQAEDTATLGSATTAWNTAVAGADAGGAPIIKAVTDYQKAYADYVEAIKTQNKTLLATAITELTAANTEMTNIDTSNLSDADNALLTAGQNLITDMTNVGNDALDNAQNLWEQTSTAAGQKVLGLIQTIGQNFEDGKITWSQAISEISQVLTSNGMSASDAAELLSSSTSGSMGDMVTAVTTAANTLTTCMTTLVTILGQLGVKIGKIAGDANTAATTAINNAKSAGEAIMSLGGSSSATGAPGGVSANLTGVKTSVTSGLGGATTTVTIPVKKLAGGGLVQRPTLAVVGEAGPEMVMPLSGAIRPGSYRNSDIARLIDFLATRDGITLNQHFTQPPEDPFPYARRARFAVAQAFAAPRAV